MSEFDEACELIAYAKTELTVIETHYRESLDEKSIKPGLLIDIKNYLENLRSALDFAARGLYSKYGVSSKSNSHIYFPYASKQQTMDGFRAANRIEQCIPGLGASRPDLVAVLESMQHWNSDYFWLPDFMELNNENKHERLTPQIRKESKELRISSGRASIRLGEGASIRMGPGASIRMGDSIIPGGQTIDVNNPPTVLGGGHSEIITWVSFSFSTNARAVMPFLLTVLGGVKRIVDDLASR